MTEAKLVPVEPTEEMLDAARYHWGPWLDEAKTQRAGRRSDDPAEIERAKEIWAQMLSAAPVVGEPAGWLSPELAVVWETYILTDGKNATYAQRAEAWGLGEYWAAEPSGGIDWEPTHISPWPPKSHTVPKLDVAVKALETISAGRQPIGDGLGHAEAARYGYSKAADIAEKALAQIKGGA